MYVSIYCLFTMNTSSAVTFNVNIRIHSIGDEPLMKPWCMLASSARAEFH